MKKFLQAFSNKTIKAKLALLSGALLMAIVGTALFEAATIVDLRQNIGAVEENIPNINDDASSVNSILNNQQTALNRLDTASDTLYSFGEMKYWLTDLAASWLSESENSANANRTKFENHLNDLAKFAPEEAKKMAELAGKFNEVSLKSVDAYADNNRVLGNSLLSESRAGAAEINKILLAVNNNEKTAIQNLKKAAAESSKTAADQVDKARKLAAAGIKNAGERLTHTAIVVFLVIIAALTLTILIVSSLITPIRAVVKSMEALAEGNLQVDLPPAGKNEIGDMIRAVEVFKHNAIVAEEMKAKQEAEMKAKLARAERIESLINNFDKKAADLLGSLATAATEMEATSQSMSAIAKETTKQSSAVAVAATQAGANVQNVASASEELTASIKEIAKQISESSKSAVAAAGSIDQTQKTVQRLSEAVSKISQVVGLITDIAEQTNLLALNATIEAARAGDVGKGFAVVASEVKALASQTQKATDDISAMIKNVQMETKEAVSAIIAVSKIIDELNQMTATVAASIEEQTAATQEISRNVQEAANGTNEVTGNITGVSTAAGESGKASNDVLDVAKQVSRQSQNMKGEIEQFLKDIRVA
jgi:methyl-accepting chemotaxis protein